LVSFSLRSFKIALFAWLFGLVGKDVNFDGLLANFLFELDFKIVRGEVLVFDSLLVK